MREAIIKKLRELEKVHDIKILFAVESGSRAWGIESPDSDYDVRFIYRYNMKDYLHVLASEFDDVLSMSFNSKMRTATADDVMFDFVGFDMYKFSKLLLKSNPSVVEWLHSPIVYIEEEFAIACRHISKWVDRKALWYHYQSMGKKNYEKYINGLDVNEKVSQKKYLYALRGVMNAAYVKRFGDIPPITFDEVRRELIQEKLIPKKVNDVLLKLLEAKKQSGEAEKIERVLALDRYIERQLQEEPVVHEGSKNVEFALNDAILVALGADNASKEKLI